MHVGFVGCFLNAARLTGCLPTLTTTRCSPVSALRCSLAGVAFDITSPASVLHALPHFGLCPSQTTPEVHIAFAAATQDSLKREPPIDRSRLLENILLPPYLGGGVQTVPLVLTDDQRRTVADLLANGTDASSVPLLNAPDVVTRLKECADHATDVLLILHALTVEIRDYKEHRTDIHYIQDIEPVLCSSLAFEGFRRMFGMFLPDFDAVMIHSSALVRRGRTFFFLGRDGGGKSTVVSLATEGDVLSDDRNILRRRADGFTVYGTPWGAIHNDTASAPLGGVFLLEKAESFGLERADPREAVHFMWEDNRPFWLHLPKSRRTRVLELLIDVARSVPIYRLRFPKDHIDWNAMDAAVAVAR